MRALGGWLRRKAVWLLLALWVWVWVLIIRDSGVTAGMAVGSPGFWVLGGAIVVSAWPLRRAYRWAYR